MNRMGFLFREIKYSVWVENREAAVEDQDDCPAQVLSDLAASSGMISVWYIDADKRNLDRVIAAFAAARDRLRNLDFCLIEEELIAPMRLEIKRSNGKTPDQQANFWHRDIVTLTGRQVARIARLMIDGKSFDRRQKEQVAESLFQGIRENHIDHTKLGTELIRQLWRSEYMRF